MLPSPSHGRWRAALGLCVLCCVCPPAAGVDYRGLYDAVYASEHHAAMVREWQEEGKLGRKRRWKQKHPILDLLNGTFQGLNVLPPARGLNQHWLSKPWWDALDVGCGAGDFVRQLWGLWRPSLPRPYVRATGVDVSQAALASARALSGIEDDGFDQRCVRGDCFLHGFAAKLPFPEKSFDAVFTSDVMEHFAEEDIQPALQEVHRVLKDERSMFVAKVSTVVEGVKVLSVLHEQGEFTEYENLHLTVQPGEWWLHQFRRAGFRCPTTFLFDHWHWSIVACFPQK